MQEQLPRVRQGALVKEMRAKYCRERSVARGRYLRAASRALETRRTSINLAISARSARGI
jgi:hypothetical protein